ncbi:MAG: tRNA pseudouridine32 synthase/23S rRNA pseudouridine746 synthase [Flavobacteriales bacterium]|jgi:tRNA pseudouridine32 synthase/23S rRNA pseudouridine746 synthase
MPIELIHQDESLLVVNKPSGLLCVPGLSSPHNLHDQVLTHFPNARVVHRLDMSTSGLVIFALNHETQRGMGKLFEHRKIYKRYEAELFGLMTENHGEIHSPLICDWERRPIQKVCWQNGKYSSTAYSVITRCRANETTRVSLKPITGRTHQLRIHMLQLGHPIVGDSLYNISGSQNAHSRLCLHACELKFEHPINQKKLHLKLKCDFF